MTSDLTFRLINKLQPGSVQKVNDPVQNWHKVRGGSLKTGQNGGQAKGRTQCWHRWQLENIGNFLRAIKHYGVKPHDIFEANDLFENTNHTQVQSTLIALASQVRPSNEAKGIGGGLGG